MLKGFRRNKMSEQGRPKVGLLLDQHHRLWVKNKATLDQQVIFAGFRILVNLKRDFIHVYTCKLHHNNIIAKSSFALSFVDIINYGGFVNMVCLLI